MNICFNFLSSLAVSSGVVLLAPEVKGPKEPQSFSVAMAISSVVIVDFFFFFILVNIIVTVFRVLSVDAKLKRSRSFLYVVFR